MVGTTAAIILGASAIAGQAASSKIASNAAKHAAQTQSTAATDAANYQRQNTDRTLGYLQQAQQAARPQPSVAGGALHQLMGLPAQGYGSGPMPTAQAGAPPSSPFTFSGQTPMAAQNGGMVMMRAPNGMQKRVNAADVEHFKAQGAQVIQ